MWGPTPRKTETAAGERLNLVVFTGGCVLYMINRYSQHVFCYFAIR
jgi:hypothetical protein